MKIKLHENDRMVEIPLNNRKTYKCRVELDIMLDIDVFAENEDCAGAIAEEVAHELPRILEKKLNEPVFDNSIYVSTWGETCTDVTEMVEEDD